jgi:hypothetical protein
LKGMSREPLSTIFEDAIAMSLLHDGPAKSLSLSHFALMKPPLPSASLPRSRLAKQDILPEVVFG